MCIRDRYQRRVRGRDHSSMKRPVSLLLLIGACSVRAWFGSNDEWEFREEIEEQYDWLKGSEWFWNGWRNVKLKADGSFWAPSPECEADQAHGCNWSAHSGYIWIQWGDAGLHRVTASADRQQLKGTRFDGDVCSGAYVGTEEPVESDLYKVLGIDEDATEADVKRAYRKLSVKYHPDKFDGQTDKFDKIREASEVLGDPDKRILYDTGGMEAVKDAEKQDAQGGQMQDPFSMFFGGNQQQGSKAKKGPDFNGQIEASLEDIYNGNKVPVNFKRRVVCRNCRSSSNARCLKCGPCPNEVKMVQRQMAPGFMVQQQQEVPSKEKCKEEETTVTAEIDRGMASGGQLRFPRMSEQRPGQIPGDVILTVHQKEHERFRRDGNDLHSNLEITLKQALLGFKHEIPHLDGHVAVVENKGMTKPFQVIRVVGEGMPQHDVPSVKGDLFVKVEVIMPETKWSKDEASWIRQHL
eukprot:TRINITY_DN18239_c0_g1_i2.p1 TRINITY_DN18239_c0_g1~~TRINITY_DN18239_c0_g1_i2.p1  ORF type:complete len:466 (+),score=133.17 TRINITY_DN18239_c0_g1_i2:87-1484(+)